MNTKTAMMIRLASRFALAAALLAAHPAWAQAGQGAVAPERTEIGAPVSVPMNVADYGKPVIEATINGRGPFKLSLDTCAGGTVLDASLVRELGLTAHEQVEVGDPTDAARIAAEAFRVETIAIGGAAFHGVEVVSWDRSSLYASPDAPRGVLGFPLFRDCLLTLDYPAGLVRIETGSLPAPDGRDIVPLSLERSIAGVRAVIAGREALAHVDSGSVGGIMLPEKFAEGLAFRAPPEVVGAARTVNSEFELSRATLEGEVRLGRHAFPEMSVTLSRPIPHVVLGTDFLRTFRVTFDQKNARARFERVEGAAPAPARRTSGLMARPGPDGLGVEKVVPGGPAEKAGLLAGDVIVEINGKDAKSMNPGELRSALTGERPVRLSVLRGGEAMEIEFTPAPAP